MNSSFSWLHLSDLHMGLAGQKTLWPMLKQRLYEDLELMHSQSGPWDLVLFTGDLTQSGTPEEYETLTQELKELWQFLARLGSTPILLSVPGNHDLKRPPSRNLAMMHLRRWWEEDEIRLEMWENSAGPLREVVTQAFHNYTNWLAEINTQLHSRIPQLQTGLLPGDFSVTIETPVGAVGIAGLNSAWLQLDGSDYEGKDVLESGLKDGDFYNGVRAITKKVQLGLDSNQVIAEVDKSRLINAYQYLYNERLRGMFNDCHDALYAAFDRIGDVDNICRLFRHSSLIWRLNDDEVRERGALESMMRRWPAVVEADRKGLERESAYARARLNSLVPLLSVREQQEVPGPT